jgi:hypothetical protein
LASRRHAPEEPIVELPSLLARLDGASFRLADEVRDIQRRAPGGGCPRFSRETGAAWIIDRAITLRSGSPARAATQSRAHINTSFAINRKGRYRIEGGASSTPVAKPAASQTLLGHPTDMRA